MIVAERISVTAVFDFSTFCTGPPWFAKVSASMARTAMMATTASSAVSSRGRNTKMFAKSCMSQTDHSQVVDSHWRTTQCRAN